MYIRNAWKYGKPLKIIQAGEFFVSNTNEFIGTLLGSCISVTLHDPVNKISGLNHFMLPGRISSVDIFEDRSAKYGITAINTLIDEMVKKGAHRKDIVAKIFGGGSVLEYEKRTNTIPMDNIRLARIMLEMEDIPIIQSDVGGKYTRKLLLDVLSGKVYCRRTTNKKIMEKVKKEEFEYVSRSFNKG
ncbi:MAG TPA: chemotaxis protein CheD [Spirochaetota bacterium]|nr:chemotaxis protein CheD [Spirochaetota bacterium]